MCGARACFCARRAAHEGAHALAHASSHAREHACPAQTSKHSIIYKLTQGHANVPVPARAQVEAWGNGGLPGVLLREARSLVAAGLAPPRGMREAVREGLLSAGLIPESGPGSCDSDEDPEWKALFK